MSRIRPAGRASLPPTGHRRPRVPRQRCVAPASRRCRRSSIARRPTRLHLGGDLFVCLMVETTALGMAEDHGRGPGVLEHVGVDIPGEGSGLLRATVFPADREAPQAGVDGAVYQGGRNADEHVGMRRQGFHRCRDSFDLLQLDRQPMHLPISGDEPPHSPVLRISVRAGCPFSILADRIGKHSGGSAGSSGSGRPGGAAPRFACWSRAFPIRWNHLIGSNARLFNELEHYSRASRLGKCSR